MPEISFRLQSVYCK